MCIVFSVCGFLLLRQGQEMVNNLWQENDQFVKFSEEEKEMKIETLSKADQIR